MPLFFHCTLLGLPKPLTDFTVPLPCFFPVSERTAIRPLSRAYGISTTRKYPTIGAPPDRRQHSLVNRVACNQTLFASAIPISRGQARQRHRRRRITQAHARRLVAGAGRPGDDGVAENGAARTIGHARSRQEGDNREGEHHDRRRQLVIAKQMSVVEPSAITRNQNLARDARGGRHDVLWCRRAE